MAGRQPARLELPPAKRLVSGSAPVGAGRRVRPRETGDALDAAAGVRFDRLRAWRQGLARRDGVPAYLVAQDRTLREIAQLAPRTVTDLALAYGMGPAKLARYGEQILALLSESDPSP
jgi:ATP-dependent DNA helicase RecQ